MSHDKTNKKKPSKEKKIKISLPYNLDVKLFEHILNDLKSTGKNGVKLGNLWINVSAAKNLNRSYTLNMITFLEIADSDKTNVWLTDFGVQSIKYASGKKRRTILAKQMPDQYLAMFKWIKSNEEMTTSEIKGQFVVNYGVPESTLILDKAISSFLIYCDYLEIINFSGKGQGSKAVITKFGSTVLDQDSDEEENSDSSVSSSDAVTLAVTPSDDAVLPKGTYPIIVKTTDRDFNWDVKSDSDWAVIDSVIASIKEGWKTKQSSPTRGGDE